MVKSLADKLKRVGRHPVAYLALILGMQTNKFEKTSLVKNKKKVWIIEKIYNIMH